MKRYSGLQPQYFPRLHYFARVLNADIYMVRDEAQFVKKHKYPNGKNGPSFQAHTPIKQPTGHFLLQVPVKHTGHLPIAETVISYQDHWQDKHLKTISINYSKAANFNKIFSEIEEILNQNYKSIGDLNLKTILWGFARILGDDIKIKDLSIEGIEKILVKQKKFRLKEIKKSSESKALKHNKFTANEKIIALMREVGANEDYCGETAMNAYMDHDIFEENGIKTTIQNWKCEEYNQLYTKAGFIPNLSIIDLLMNESHDKVVSIIKGNEA